MSRVRCRSMVVRRDEVLNEYVERFHGHWAVQTRCLHVRSNSTQPTAKAAGRLSPVNFSAEGCELLLRNR